MRRRRLRLLACLVVTAFLASAPGSAAAFGTIDTGGQNREHERLTRAALACAGDAGSDPNCFEPRSIDYLAGHDREFGAVGAPDNDELSDPSAHCDNADFLTGGYPRTRDQATASLVDCVNQMRSRLGEGVVQRPGSARRPGPGDPSRGEPQPGVQSARSRRRARQMHVPRTIRAGSCTEHKTSTRTATGPMKQTRPVRSETTTRRV